MRDRLLLTIALGAPLTGCGAGSVERAYRGETFVGREVSADALSQYSMGLLLETSGDFRGAASAFRKASELDPTGVEPVASLVRVTCKVSPEAGIRILDDEGRRHQPNARLFLERSRCGRGREDAMISAEVASVLDPELEPSCVERIPDLSTPSPSDGAKVDPRMGARCRSGSPSPSESCSSLARCTALRPRRRDGEVPTFAALDRLVAEDDHVGAARMALRLGVHPRELALRALLLGKMSAGLRRANAEQAAEPEDGDSWIAIAISSMDAPSDVRTRRPASVLGRRAIVEWLMRVAPYRCPRSVDGSNAPRSEDSLSEGLQLKIASHRACSELGAKERQ